MMKQNIVLIRWEKRLVKYLVLVFVMELVEIRWVIYLKSFLNIKFKAWSITGRGEIRSDEACLSIKTENKIFMEQCSPSETNAKHVFTYDVTVYYFFVLTFNKSLIKILILFLFVKLKTAEP